MPADSPEIAVIGAGVVGLACAAELARRGRSVVVLERHGQSAQETTSRNSEVIHAGIYYPADSLKTRCCVEGRQLLYERCERLRIPHQRIGKVVVATCDEEIAALEKIHRQAHANGVTSVEWKEGDQVRVLEPNVTAVAGLWSPDSGIVDAHAYTDSFEAELDALGGMVIYQTEVSGLERRGDAWRVHTKGSRGEAFALDVPCVLNSAGLGSDRMAALAGVDVDEAGWRLHPCKGDYFSVAPALGRLVSHLIYPVPAGPGLGIHVTLDLAGRIRLGPDAHYVSEISYGVDPSGARRFTEAVSRYLPGIEVDQVAPEMAGIRPKLQGPGDPFRDFVIAESSDHGAPGIVHLIGIESPGLTASAAIARRAADLVLDLL